MQPGDEKSLNQSGELGKKRSSDDGSSSGSRYAEERTVTLGSISGEMFASESPSAVLADSLIGEIIDGKYGIDKRLGIGGMSVVFQARDLTLGRTVALKMMPLHSGYTQKDMMRFQQEAQTISRLEHPNLVRIYELKTDSAPPYLVMEYIEGRSLADEIIEEGPVGIERGIDIMLQVCAALKHAHEKGVIHRDLKPANILLQKTSDGSEMVKIVDFGIAKVSQEDNSIMQNFTRTGEILGSPLYMSPEQCQGKKLDSRTDIYSLGCVFYAMFTGRPPFLGETAFETIELHMHEQPIAISQRRSDLPHAIELDNILFKALAKDPEQRFQSVSEMEAALKLVGSDEGLGAWNFFMTLWDHVRSRAAAQKSRGISVKFVLVLLVLTAGISAFAIWHAYDRHSGEESIRRWPESDLAGQSAFDEGDYPKAHSLLTRALSQARRSENTVRINSSVESLIDLYRVTRRDEKARAFEAQLRPTPSELRAGMKTYKIVAEAQSQLQQLKKDAESLKPDAADARAKAKILRGLTSVVGDCRHMLVRKQGYQTFSIATGTIASKCERLLRDAESIARSVVKPNDPLLGRIYHNLALAYLAASEPDKSLVYFQKAEKILDEANSIPPLERVDYLDDEALFYNMHGETGKAIEALKKELELAGGLYSDSPTAGVICFELADMYQRRRDSISAGRYADIALNILEKSQDQELDKTKAWLYYFKGDIEQAIPAAQSALKKYEDNEEKDYWKLSETLSLLADCYMRNGSTLSKAEPLLKRAIAISIRLNEPYSELRKTVKLARLYLLQKRYKEAVATYESCLPLAQRLYGESDGYCELIEEFAFAQKQNKNYRDAIANLNRALTIFEKEEGAKDRQKAVMEQLAVIYNEMGHADKAKEMRSRVDAMR